MANQKSRYDKEDMLIISQMIGPLTEDEVKSDTARKSKVRAAVSAYEYLKSYSDQNSALTDR